MKIRATQNLKTLKGIGTAFDKKPWLDAISADAEKDILDNLDSEGANLGNQYEKSGRAIADGGTTLKDTNNMYSSIHGLVERGDVWVQVARNQYKREKGSKRVTASSIAQQHNEGIGVPKREFFKLSDGMIKSMPETVKDYMK